MRKKLPFLATTTSALCLGLYVTANSFGALPDWRPSLVGAAQAQTSCVFPPSGQPGGLRCDADYLREVRIDKNLGAAGVTNSINVAIGNLFQAETDYTGGGPVKLTIARYYNSVDAGKAGALGPNWRGSYSRAIGFSEERVAKVMRDDGRVFVFTRGEGEGRGGEGEGRGERGAWRAEADVNYRLTQTRTGWSLVTDQDETENYDASGKLVSYANRAGVTLTLAYDSKGRLAKVADSYGRTLSYGYVSSSSPLVAQVTAPDGTVYGYAYDAKGRFATLTYPDGGKRQYVYENASFPTALTGTISQSGIRKATYAYDAQGRATSSVGALGANAFSADYTFQARGVVTRINAMGGKAAFLFEGINGTAKLIQTYDVTRNAFATNVYDANGNVVKKTDFGGSVTISRYNLRNLLVEQTTG